MSEMLSQEEIDALLRGDSTPASQEPASFGSNDNDLTSEEIDALGEIGNISMGTSATTLFTLLNNKVNITTPKVTVSTWDELAADYPTPYVAVQVRFTEGLEGTNLLILKEDDVKIITDLMMGGMGTSAEGEITDLHLSAIGEAMNQMIGSSSTSLSTMFNKKIDISPPRAFMMFFQETDSVLQQFDGSDKVVKIAFKMEVGDIIDSEIMQLLPIDFAKSLVSNLFNSMAPAAPPQQQAPPKQEAVHHAPPAQTPPPRVEHQPQPQYQPQYQHQPQQQPQHNYGYQDPYGGGHGYGGGEYRPPAPPREEPKYVNVQPVQYQSFDAGDAWGAEKESIDLIMDVPLEITVELGRTKKLIRDILEFGPGTILELDKLAGEPVDILVNGKYVAKGEVVVIDESFGVRITDIVSTSKRLGKIK